MEDSNSDFDAFPLPPPAQWWREWEIIALAALVFGAFFLRVSDLTIRGEESRWATISMEMMRGGDWIVPRQQGEPFFSRPPLQNWLIAGLTYLHGRCDALAIRLPTVSAVLATTLLIYAFGRTFLTRLGAFAAGLAFASMGEILQMGRIAESDVLFAFLMSAAWFFWFWGYRADWPAAIPWVAGYGLAALAALQKGPQAPVCFAGAVGLYLLIRGEWRRLLAPAHLLGILTFAVVIGAWQVPYYRALGPMSSLRIWLNDSGARYLNWRTSDVVAHLIRYPIEVIGVTAPFSLLLVAYLSRRFRRGIGGVWPIVGFFAVCMAVTFLPCWAPPTATTRNVMPIYPCIALLAGLAVERIAVTRASPRLRTFWLVSWRIMAGAMIAAPFVLLLTRFVPLPDVRVFSPPLLAIAIMAIVSWTAAFAVRWGLSGGGQRLQVSAFAVALFVGGLYATVIVDGMVRRSEDTAAAVAGLKAKMPSGAHLVSFNPTHHLFAYHFGDPIELRGLPDAKRDRDVTWFCYMSEGEARMAMPFPSEVVAVISMERYRQPKLKGVVVVGRRLTESEAADRATATREKSNQPGG